MSHHLQSQNAVLTGTRQTMAAWSRVIESREDIPTFYKSCFDKYFDSNRPFPHVVLTPALDRFPRRTTEKLVCDTSEALYIFERNRNEIDATCYPYHEVCAVEIGVVVLESWLTIHGRTSQGEAGVARIELNTTSLHHFDTLLRKLRPSSQVVDKAQIAAEKDKFDSLATASFKFMNYGRESLVPGETVLTFLLQPEIRQTLWTVFGRAFYKTISLAHLVIITDRELILIRNVERTHESHVDRYGGVWQYIPLHRLDSVTLSNAGSERLTLSIRHQPGETIERFFDASNQPGLERFCSQLQTLIERTHAA
jgi:hypothetical protein